MSRQESRWGGLRRFLPSPRTLHFLSRAVFFYALVNLASAQGLFDADPDAEERYRNSLGSSFDSCVDAVKHFAACYSRQLYTPGTPLYEQMVNNVSRVLGLERDGAVALLTNTQFQPQPPELSTYKCPADGLPDGFRQDLFAAYNISSTAHQESCNELMQHSEESFTTSMRVHLRY